MDMRLQPSGVVIQDEIIGTAGRLAALRSYDIVDTPPEPEFDDVVRIAQAVCETPVALVSLVGLNRQWFKARVGFGPCQTAIGDSVCAHALKEHDLLVIADLTLDPRTMSNNLVVGEPHIRFYAGAVLRSPEGEALGTLCVIDTAPRPDGLTLSQADALRALGRQTMAIMEMRREVNLRVNALVLEREARRATIERAQAIQIEAERVRLDEARSRLAQQAGGIGTFDVEIETDRCFVSAEFCRVFGLPSGIEFVMSDLQDVIHEDDRHLASSVLSRNDGTAPLDIEYRIRRKNDGAVRWISRRSVFHADSDGVVRRMIGVVQDITERGLVESRRTALIRFGDVLHDVTTAMEVARLIGRTLGETLGLSRAGLCQIDHASGTLLVESNWTNERSASSLGGRYPLGLFKRTLARLETGMPTIVANIPAAAWMADDAAWYATAGTTAKITVPVTNHGKLVGLVFAHSDIPRTWSSGEVEFVQTIADRGYTLIAKLKAEEHQRLLNEELSHRLKNTLSMVQAIATQTLRNVTEKDAVDAFDKRIIALSRAHDVLLQQSWSAARIEVVIERVLSLHGRADHIGASGPNLTLGPKATLSLSLLLHELATNAAKYGALSCEAGRIALTWHVDEKRFPPELSLVWEEIGGPSASAPKRKGFGSRLISMGIAGTGKAKLHYADTGLKAEFTAPLASVTEG